MGLKSLCQRSEGLELSNSMQHHCVQVPRAQLRLHDFCDGGPLGRMIENLQFRIQRTKATYEEPLNGTGCMRCRTCCCGIVVQIALDAK